MISTAFQFTGILAACVVLLVTTAKAQSSSDATGPKPKLFQAVLPSAKQVTASHYMSGGHASCKPFSISGYDGLPTQRCRYNQGKLSAEVVLLDPGAEQLTRWVLFICEGFDLNGNDPAFQRSCGRRLLMRIKQQSSGHFPVAGVVLESGKNFVFRDGITAIVPGIVNGSRRQLTNDEFEAAISTPITAWGKYARLEGTTFDQYQAYGRVTDLNGKLIDESALTFPQLVGTRYREAWGNNLNTLLRAWTCANLEYIKTKMACVKLPSGAPGSARNTP